MLNGPLNLWSTDQSTMIEGQYLMVTRQLEPRYHQKVLSFLSFCLSVIRALFATKNPPIFAKDGGITKRTHYLSFWRRCKSPGRGLDAPGELSSRKLDLWSRKHTPSTVTLAVIVKHSICDGDWYGAGDNEARSWKSIGVYSYSQNSHSREFDKNVWKKMRQ